MGIVSDALAGATGSDSNSWLKYATWIADESKLLCSRSNHVAKSSQENIVLIDKERTCAENTSHNQSRSIDVSTRPVANAFDFLPDATGNGGGKTPKAASWIVDDPDCHTMSEPIQLRVMRSRDFMLMME